MTLEARKGNTSPNCTLSAAGSLRSLLGFSRSRPTAAKATKPTWGQASIPNPTIRQVMLDWCAENGKDCVPFAEGVKDWYLNKADYMIAVINGECYEIPAAEITIKNNDADANAYTSYGAGPRITIIGQLPSGYEKYKV